MNDFETRYGPWALVTGASSGLGAEYARQLGARGVHVVLVARRQERLEALAAELGAAHGVQTRVIGIDLTARGACEAVVEQVRDLEVGLLVNNAGFGSDAPEPAGSRGPLPPPRPAGPPRARRSR